MEEDSGSYTAQLEEAGGCKSTNPEAAGISRKSPPADRTRIED
jgi:hypothetical protein